MWGPVGGSLSSIRFPWVLVGVHWWCLLRTCFCCVPCSLFWLLVLVWVLVLVLSHAPFRYPWCGVASFWFCVVLVWLRPGFVFVLARSLFWPVTHTHCTRTCTATLLHRWPHCCVLIRLWGVVLFGFCVGSCLVRVYVCACSVFVWFWLCPWFVCCSVLLCVVSLQGPQH